MKLESLVNVEGKNVYLINFKIGDYSKDGHEKMESYLVQSKKPVLDIRAAHFKANDVLGFDIGSICEEYEKNSLDSEVTKKLKELNYDMESFDEFDDEDNPVELWPEKVLDIWLFLLNNVDKELELKYLKLPCINDNHAHDGKELSSPGYGCFS
jgi:hypothetical protein